MFVVSAAADAAEPALLTGATVAAFVRSLPPSGALIGAFAATDEGDVDRVGRGIGAIVERMRRSGDDAALTLLVRDHGFASLDEWQAVGQRVMRAYLALSLADGPSATGPDPARMLDIATAEMAIVARFAAEIEFIMDGN